MDKRKLYEVEMRICLNGKKVKALLKVPYTTSSELDRYFRYNLDLNKQWVVRIRKRNNCYFLTYKSNSSFGEGSWREVEIKITRNEAKKLADFFLANDYVEEVMIFKKRRNYKYKGYELNIDCVQGLGNFMEIEKMSKFKDIEATKSKIINLIDKLGIDRGQIVEKGYVSLIREKNARS